MGISPGIMNFYTLCTTVYGLNHPSVIFKGCFNEIVEYVILPACTINLIPVKMVIDWKAQCTLICNPTVGKIQISESLFCLKYSTFVN